MDLLSEHLNQELARILTIPEIIRRNEEAVNKEIKTKKSES